MAYWWVSQNQTFRQERDGGYLWAPRKDRRYDGAFDAGLLTFDRPSTAVMYSVRGSGSRQGKRR